MEESKALVDERAEEEVGGHVEQPGQANAPDPGHPPPLAESLPQRHQQSLHHRRWPEEQRQETALETLVG